MTIKLLTLPLLSALLVGTVSGQQVVLDVEDLSGFAPLTAGYGGVADWGSWAHSDLPSATYPAHSGINKILSVGLQQPIVFGQDVVFDGAYVISANNFSFELSYQGSVVHTTSVVSPNPGGPAVWLPSGYTGPVDELRYIAAVNVHAVDLFTFTVGPAVLGTSYCTSGPNSSGASAVITATGSTSVVDNDFTLSAGPLAATEPGIFYFGLNQISTPFGNGTRCVGGTVHRTPPVQAVGGVMTRTLDLTDGSAASLAIAPMTTWNFQAWFRDPAGGGQGFDLSNGVEIAFLP